MAFIAQSRERLGAVDWTFLGRLEFWFEAMWLSVLALVPLLFSFNNTLVTFDEPKSYALHFFALTTLALLITAGANQFVIARRSGEKIESIDVGAWLRSNTSNLLIAAVIAFMFVYVLSTALSQMPFYSFWGISPGVSGYNLYSFLSMMVIFFAVVTYLRSRAQLFRIFYTITVVGTLTSLYGVSQHFGWDPLDAFDTSGRVVASFGNPIYFGAYLVMSIPITAALLLDRRSSGNRLLLALLVIGIGLQLGAMWFTGSRGPLAGLLAALAILGLASIYLLPIRRVATMLAALAAALVVAAVLVALPADDRSARAVEFGGELSALTEDDSSTGYIQGGLGGRSEIWADVLELSASWETFQEDTGLSRILRPVFGFGPDMLRFSSSLVSRPRVSFEIVDHAHNRVLQALAEQGWAGLLALLSVVFMAGWLLFASARKLRASRGESGDALTAIAFVALAAALTGVAIEQSAGVGRVSDLLTSWVLIGLVVVLYRRLSGVISSDSWTASGNGEASSSATSSTSGAEDSGTLSGIPFFIGLVALIGAISIFALIDGQILRASRLVYSLEENVEFNTAYNQMVDARNAAPQIEHFTVFPVEVLFDEAQAAAERGEPELAADIAEQALRLLLEYHDRNPLAIRTRILLAETSGLLVDIGVIDFRDEMLIRYESLVEQFPNEGLVISTLARAYAAAEQYDRAIETADRAIALEDEIGDLPQAWWARANSLERLDRIDEAIADYKATIDRVEAAPGFGLLAHEDLADLYEELGDDEAAEFHRSAAEELRDSLIES